MLIFTRNATNATSEAIAQYNKSVVMKKMGNHIFIISKIIVISVFQFFMRRFKLNEQQRNSIYEADNIRPAFSLAFALQPKLANGQEVIVLRIFEIKYPQRFTLRMPLKTTFIRYIVNGNPFP